MKRVKAKRPPHGGKWRRDPDTDELVLVGEDGKLPKKPKTEDKKK